MKVIDGDVEVVGGIEVAWVDILDSSRTQFVRRRRKVSGCGQLQTLEGSFETYFASTKLTKLQPMAARRVSAVFILNAFNEAS
jgi:hypothetical protein